MKTTVQSVRLLCLAAVMAVAACDDGKVDDTVSVASTPLRVEQIIASPKAAAPGDTVTLTADVQSNSQNVGDIPVTAWTADGGTFVENDKLTVRWVAPATPGFYRVSVRATNDANSVTRARDLFVGVRSLLVNSQAGEVRLKANGTDFFYLRSPFTSSILAVEVFSYAGAPVDAVPSAGATGFELVYAPGLAFEVHATTVTQPESLSVASANPRPRQIYVGDLTTGTLQRISQDLSVFDSTRRNQFGFPAVSPDGQLIAYQGVVTNAFSASLDSVDIFVYRPAGPTRIRATGAHSNHKNFFPSFSTDQNWLTFISDRSGSSQWEIYGMPVSGTTVDVAQASVVRLSDTGGTITRTLAGAVPAFPLRAWNPAASILAIVSGDNTLYLITTDAGGASLADVTGIPASIQELVWSPSGAQLAVVATGRDADDQSVMQVFMVAGGTPELRYQTTPGDVVRDVAFSPDEQWMVFRLTRSGSAWLEIMDMSGGVLPSSVPLTPVSPAGGAADYRPVMSLSPAWGTGNILYYPDFTGGSTPGIRSVDVSDAIQ